MTTTKTTRKTPARKPASTKTPECQKCRSLRHQLVLEKACTADMRKTLLRLEQARDMWKEMAEAAGKELVQKRLEIELMTDIPF